jgi:PPM family protein phosphatase
MLNLWKFLKKQTPAPNLENRGSTESWHSADAETSKRIIFNPCQNICAISDVGLVRDHNEDAYCISQDYSWFAVADGMGGHDAGEVAAALAIQTLVEYITPERMANALAANAVDTLLMDAVMKAQECVLGANQGTESAKPMGCTLAVAGVADGLVSCNVGDVRCYLLHEGVLRQISRDHSTVGALVEAGELTLEQARVHPHKNQVSQAIGMPSGVIPETFKASLTPDDIIFICSDGLWETMPHEELQAILANKGTIPQLATQAVDRSLALGGFDNSTVILYQVKAEGMTTETIRFRSEKPV